MTEITTAPTAETNSTNSSLVTGLKTDRPEDSRSCPHDCHGSLSLTDDNRVLCETCRCTPDGIYLPPDDESDDSGGEWACSQFEWFYPSARPRGSGLHGAQPHPSRLTNSNEQERYRVSNRVILPGGHTEAYPHELTSRDGSLI